jgi:hypothetical protein
VKAARTSRAYTLNNWRAWPADTFNAWLVAGFALFFGVGVAHAVPFDPQYAHAPTTQKLAVKRHVRRVLWPTLISPALVRSGGNLSILLRIRRSPEGRMLEPTGKGRDFRVYLESRDKRIHRCRARRWRRSKNRLWLDVQVPQQLARDVYGLRVVAPGIDDSQPNSVRVFGRVESPETFRFAVITDHQLWDPSFKLTGRKLSSGQFPKHPRAKLANEAITEQGFKELALLDPDFVLHTGDLIFGFDFASEYAQVRDILKRAHLPVFGVPGNHDGYAIYTLKLRGNLMRFVKGAITCRKHLSASGAITWRRAWQFISCFYGDVKDRLFSNLQQDGLVYWHRQLGPSEYAFDHGRFRFIGINTYGGTPQRRHAFAIYVDLLDLHLGAPAVDNYGGYLSDEQLYWLGKTLKAARASGLIPVVFAHHDPRGNPGKQRYQANEPFPTSPLGGGPFEEWNYDSAAWDSNIFDMRVHETPSKNSAIRFLALLAQYGGYFISGHIHQDGHHVYRVGSKLGPHTVKRRLELIRTTSAASSVKKGAYWGYRVIEAQGEKLTSIDYAPQHGLGSVPAGNLWSRALSDSKRLFVSALPKETTVTTRWVLPTKKGGYRFRLGAGEKTTAPLAKLVRPEVTEIAWGEKQTTYWVKLTLPACAWPPKNGRQVRAVLSAIVARENKPPEVTLAQAVAGSDSLRPLEGARISPGAAVLLSAAQSRDPEGDRIIRYHWRIGKRHAWGQKIVHSFEAAGQYDVQLTVLDEAGAATRVSLPLTVAIPKVPHGCQGCAATQSFRRQTRYLPWFLLFGAVGLWWRARRRKQRSASNRQTSV